MENESRILIVDDEDRIRRLLKMYLEREQYTIEEADNGDTALEMALQNDYDLILLDLMMPGKDGIEVCKGVREKKATPIIMLTAKGEEVKSQQIQEQTKREVIWSSITSLLHFSKASVVHNLKFVTYTPNSNDHFRCIW